MMDVLSNLQLGALVIFNVENLFLCFAGCLIGTLIGVLPGIGPLAAMSMLLPTTFLLPPEGAIIMLAGIYYGSQYGGSTTAILVNLPGEPASIVTCLDGHQMALNGRAGAALAIAALASLFAGTACTLLIAFAAPPLSAFALSFATPEYFSLMVLGLTGSIVMAHGSAFKAFAMALLGIAFGLVGTDVSTGFLRFTFGLPQLFEGVGFVAIALGLLGVAEIISNLGRQDGKNEVIGKIGKLLPTSAEWRQAWPAILRGTGLGAILGILPGGGAILSSFASYTLERRLARDPSRFGKGAIEGVAGPEAANNAGAQTSFIPLLTLGIPSNTIMAVMVGALMIQGIQPGPEVMTKQPELFWGLIVSMFVGNVMLVIINLPMVGVWVKLLQIPYRLLFPVIVLICATGAYSVNMSAFDVGLVSAFSLLGYVMLKLGCEVAPFALGFILGPLMEENLRRAMVISRGDATVFLTRPVSAVLIGFSAALVLLLIIPKLRRTRDQAFQEE